MLKKGKSSRESLHRDSGKKSKRSLERKTAGNSVLNIKIKREPNMGPNVKKVCINGRKLAVKVKSITTNKAREVQTARGKSSSHIARKDVVRMALMEKSQSCLATKECTK